MEIRSVVCVTPQTNSQTNESRRKHDLLDRRVHSSAKANALSLYINTYLGQTNADENMINVKKKLKNLKLFICDKTQLRYVHYSLEKKQACWEMPFVVMLKWKIHIRTKNRMFWNKESSKSYQQILFLQNHLHYYLVIKTMIVID